MGCEPLSRGKRRRIRRRKKKSLTHDDSGQWQWAWQSGPMAESGQGRGTLVGSLMDHGRCRDLARLCHERTLRVVMLGLVCLTVGRGHGRGRLVRRLRIRCKLEARQATAHVLIWFVRPGAQSSLGAHLLWWALGIVAIFKLPLGLFEPDPRSLCFALCIRSQALHFRVVIRPNLLVESLPFSLFLPNPNTCFCPDVRFPNSSLKGLLICVPCHFQSLASTHNIIITAITK